MKPAAVRRLEPPPHATPQTTNAFRRPRRERRVLLTDHDFCNTILRHVHLLSIARLRCTRSTPRSPNPTNGVASAGTPGRFALTMRPALRSIRRSRVPPSGGRGHPESWWAPISVEPSKGRPVPRRCLPRARSARRPRRPCPEPCSRPFDPPPAARTAFPQSPVKGLTPCDSRRLPSTSARSTRPPPFRETNESRSARARHRSWGFAALQSGVQRSFAVSLRRGDGAS